MFFHAASAASLDDSAAGASAILRYIARRLRIIRRFALSAMPIVHARCTGFRSQSHNSVVDTQGSEPACSKALSLRSLMSEAIEERAADALTIAVSRCDVCSVTREGGIVVIHFGEESRSALDAAAKGVELRHRVVVGEDTASRLQELMAALLTEDSSPRQGAT